MLIPKRRLPAWTSGCFCCSLETCCNVQGFALLVYYAAAFAGLLTAGIIAATGGLDCTWRTESRSEYGHRWSTSSWPYGRLDCNAEQVLMIVVLFLTLYVVTSFAATVAFLRGIFLRRPSLFVAYNVTLVLHVALDAAFATWTFFAFAWRGLFLIAIIPDCVLWLYMLVCAETLYHQMKDGVDVAVVGEVQLVRETLQQSPTRLASTAAGAAADPQQHRQRQSYFEMKPSTSSSVSVSASAPPSYLDVQQECAKEPQEVV